MAWFDDPFSRKCCCSFCNRSHHHAGPFVEGPGDVFICPECCEAAFDFERGAIGQCSFCGADTLDVGRMMASPKGVLICRDCKENASRVLQLESASKAKRAQRFTLWNLLRAQAGLAGIVAIAAHVHFLRPVANISGFEYTIITAAWGTAAYVLVRCMSLWRLTALLLAMVFSAIASTMVMRLAFNHPVESAIYGMAIAFSMFIAFGWLDRARAPRICKMPEPSAKSAEASTDSTPPSTFRPTALPNSR